MQTDCVSGSCPQPLRGERAKRASCYFSRGRFVVLLLLSFFVGIVENHYQMEVVVKYLITKLGFKK